MAAAIAIAVAASGCAATIAGQAQVDPGAVVVRSSLSSTVSTASSTPTTRSTAATAVPPRTISETGSQPPTSSSTRAGTSSADPSQVAGIDIASILADLGSNHVALVRSSISKADLATAVTDARSKGLHLSVVSIGDDIDDDDTSTIAQAVFDAVGGTVLVLSPTSLYAHSAEMTDDAVDAANTSAANAPDDLAAVTAFITEALTGLDARTTGSSARSTTAAGPTGTAKTAPAVVEGITIADVVSALGDDHIAVEKAATGIDNAGLAALAVRARSKSLELSIVVLAKDVPGHLVDVAIAIGDSVPGTILMMSPTRVAIASDTLTSDDIHQAVQAVGGAAADPTYLAAATAAVNSLLG